MLLFFASIKEKLWGARCFLLLGLISPGLGEAAAIAVNLRTELGSRLAGCSWYDPLGRTSYSQQFPLLSMHLSFRPELIVSDSRGMLTLATSYQYQQEYRRESSGQGHHRYTLALILHPLLARLRMGLWAEAAWSYGGGLTAPPGSPHYAFPSSLLSTDSALIPWLAVGEGEGFRAISGFTLLSHREVYLPALSYRSQQGGELPQSLFILAQMGDFHRGFSAEVLADHWSLTTEDPEEGYSRQGFGALVYYPISERWHGELRGRLWRDAPLLAGFGKAGEQGWQLATSQRWQLASSLGLTLEYRFSQLEEPAKNIRDFYRQDVMLSLGWQVYGRETRLLLPPWRNSPQVLTKRAELMNSPPIL